ncbi:DUF6287 domain-containing protein [Lactococcus kimchii]|uniref:DUF6287 domain-containing protein n=1 Tax=Lactococcus sp. S-13 TaxID=2507158 RepID=UPI0010234367|nr:DUF6287 domain-containing protein [Lactococcus sp. S-13]RZI47918.1 hypothetical protein EQJ87_10890 [Lactococcus sp. S-13]
MMKKIIKFSILFLVVSVMLPLSACSGNKVEQGTDFNKNSRQVSTQKTQKNIDELPVRNWVGNYRLYNVPSSTSSLMFSGLSIQKEGKAAVYLNGAEIMANGQGDALIGKIKITRNKPNTFSDKKIWGYQTIKNTPIVGEDTPSPIEVTPNAYITITFTQEALDEINHKYGDNLTELSQTWISYESNNGENILTSGSEIPTVLIPKTTDNTYSSSVATEVSEKMNFDEISSGNYSSIEGTWENSQGETITISENTIEASAFKTLNGDAQATINGLSINIPSQNDAQGNPKVVEEDNIYKGEPVYSKTLEVAVDTGANPNASFNFLSLGTSSVNGISQIAFLPANKTPYNMQVEIGNDASTEDRIFLNMAQQPVVDVNNTYLKVN